MLYPTGLKAYLASGNAMYIEGTVSGKKPKPELILKQSKGSDVRSIAESMTSQLTVAESVISRASARKQLRVLKS